MALFKVFTIFYLAAVLGAHLAMRSFSLRQARYVFWLAVIGIFLFEAHFLYADYRLLVNDAGFGRYFLPPYTPIIYFLFDRGFKRIYGGYVISLLVAGFWFLAMRILNRRYENCFFYEEESYLAATSIFMCGYPGLLFYLPIFLLTYSGFLSFASIRSYLKKETILPRLSFRYLWVPTALFVILIISWLSSIFFWRSLLI